jgi:hypothetical protein
VKSKISLLKRYIEKQSDDPSLWFAACFISEMYLQKELRRIAWLIEEASNEEIELEINKYEERHVTYH